MCYSEKEGGEPRALSLSLSSFCVRMAYTATTRSCSWHARRQQIDLRFSFSLFHSFLLSAHPKRRKKKTLVSCVFKCVSLPSSSSSRMRRRRNGRVLFPPPPSPNILLRLPGSENFLLSRLLRLPVGNETSSPLLLFHSAN